MSNEFDSYEHSTLHMLEHAAISNLISLSEVHPSRGIYVLLNKWNSIKVNGKKYQYKIIEEI